MEAIWVTCVVIAIAGWLYIYVLRDPILDVYDTIAPILRFHIARWRGESVKHFAAQHPTPPAVTSSVASGTGSAVPVRGDAVAPDTYQSVPSVPAPRNDAPSAATAHKFDALDDDELFTQLVLLKRNGEWLLSANTLAAAFGGTRADQLKRIAKLRNEATPDSTRAPISGRRLPSGVQFASDMIEEASKA